MAEDFGPGRQHGWGSLPHDWVWSRLDRVCVGIFDCPHSTPQLVSDGPFLARTQDVLTGVFRSDAAGKVSEETYRERVTRAEPRHGDLLFSREGAYHGVAAEVPAGVRVCLGQRMVLIRPDPAVVVPRFLRYWLNSPLMAQHLRGHRDGSAAERLNLPTIRGLPVALPPLQLQRQVARVLGALDDKIELNRAMGETLEAMTRALFRSWFVDFDPVRAKLEGRRTGLPESVANIFPDSLTASDLGVVPLGWEIGSLSDVAELRRDLVDPRARPDDTFHHFSLPAYDNGQRPEVQLGSEIKSVKYRVPSGAVLLSKLNPSIPRIWLVDVDPAATSIASTEFLVLMPKAPSTREYLFDLARSTELVGRLRSLATGTSGSHQRARPDDVLRIPIVRPGPGVLSSFARSAAPLLDRSLVARRESWLLTMLRDTLLPKLVAGELRGRDAERIAVEAGA